MAALAAILFVVVWGMSEHDRLFGLLRMPNGDTAVLLLTFALTILVDLTVAIGVGVTLVLLLFMARMSTTVSIDRGNRADQIDQRDTLLGDVEVFRIDDPFFFGVAGSLMDTYREPGAIPRVLILRLERVPVLDASGVAAIVELRRRAEAAGTRINMCAANPDVAATLERAQNDGDNGRHIRTAKFAEAMILAKKSKTLTADRPQSQFI